MISTMVRASVRGLCSGDTVRRRGQRLLRALGREEDELCVLLTDDDEIQGLNRDWRQKDKPTDVLSFSQLSARVVPGVPTVLGDVVISVPTAMRQVPDGCLERLWPALGATSSPPWTLSDELGFLLLHGTLHLLGHDHEVEAERRLMEAEESRYLPLVLGRARRKRQ